MRISLVKLALAGGLILLSFGGSLPGATAQTASTAMKGNLDVRQSFDTGTWLGSAIYSKTTGQKLICTMRNKDAVSESITISWDGKKLRMTVAQRSLVPVSASVQLSYQGMVVPSSGGTVSYLRSVRSIEIGGEKPMDTLRGRKSIDINIVGEAKAMTVQLTDIDNALDKLAECFGG